MKSRYIAIVIIVLTVLIAGFYIRYMQAKVYARTGSSSEHAKSLEKSAPKTLASSSKTSDTKSVAKALQQNLQVESVKKNEKTVELLRLNRHWVEQAYGPVLPAFLLPAEAENKLKDLLVERAMSQNDAHDLAVEQHTDTSGDYNKIDYRVLSDVDAQIEHLVGPIIMPKIRTMIECYSELSGINKSFKSAEMGKYGASLLSPQQKLDLAQAYHEVFAKNSVALAQSDAKNHPPANDVERFSVTPDPVTGLTPLDQQVIDRLAQSLSLTQIAVVKDHLKVRTKYYRDKFQGSSM